MEPILYDKRIELSKDVPELGQFKVMENIPQFNYTETISTEKTPSLAPESIKVAVFNMEHGYRFNDIVTFMKECPDMQDIDILFGNELDDGTLRSGNINTSEQIAQLLDSSYAYGLEFIELVDSKDEKGYEGNTIFSRWPIVYSESLHQPEAYNWYYDRQHRIGARVAVFAEIDIKGQHVGAVCVHLENRTDGEGRAKQMKAVFDRAKELWPDIPVVIGGDCNTNTFDGNDKDAIGKYFNELDNGAMPRNVEDYEPLLNMSENYGYNYKDFNGKHLITRRKPMVVNDKDLPLHLDWIFAKGLTCIENGCVSTLIEDFTWAKPNSRLRMLDYKQLSDHNAVWATCKLK